MTTLIVYLGSTVLEVVSHGYSIYECNKKFNAVWVTIIMCKAQVLWKVTFSYQIHS